MAIEFSLTLIFLKIIFRYTIKNRSILSEKCAIFAIKKYNLYNMNYSTNFFVEKKRRMKCDILLEKQIVIVKSVTKFNNVLCRSHVR